MKKLDRNGFTLVELLAVIVILAIVVGITLVTVLPTIKKSRERSFQLTADSSADYYDKNYQLYSIGNDESVFKTDSSYASCLTENGICNVKYREAGLKEDNYTYGKLMIDATTGRVCIMLQRNTNGEFYDSEGNAGNGITFSSSCTDNQKNKLRDTLPIN